LAAQQHLPIPNHQLFIIRPDGTGLKQITHRLDQRYGSPAISPDGQTIAADCAFAHDSLQGSHVVVMNLYGSGLRDMCPGSMPSWSPDGRLLAFHVYGNGPLAPGGAIHVMNADGTGEEEVIDHWGSPRWLPGADKIICLGPDQSLRFVDLRTGRETLAALTAPKSTGSSSTRLISPLLFRAYQGFGVTNDGSRLCFGDTNAGGIRVAEIVDQSRLKPLHHFIAGQPCTFCSWAPDNRRIVFAMKTGDAPRNSQLYILDIESKLPPTSIAGQPADSENVNPQWSPDGHWLIFSSDPPE
jgi:Tol biopolymer transport system component